MKQEPSGASPRGNPPDLSVGRKVKNWNRTVFDESTGETVWERKTGK